MSQAGFFFYTGDWLKDTRCLSLEARGAWIDLLCALHEAGGSISWPLRAYDQYLGTIERDGVIYCAREILDELLSVTICGVVTEANGNITVSCRRMLRKDKSAEANRKRQERFRAKQQSNGPVTTKCNGSSSSSSSSSSLNIKRGSHCVVEFPPDWLWLKTFVESQNSGLPVDQFLDFAWWDAVSETCGGLSEVWLKEQFAGIKRWILDNPSRTPTPKGYRRFVGGWLQRSYERERRVPNGKTAQHR